MHAYCYATGHIVGRSDMKYKWFLVIFLTMGSVLPLQALEMGFYAGLSSLYPYDPVYCKEDGDGACFGFFIYTSKSAPLPPTEKHCLWSDLSAPSPNNWYQWEPRVVPKDKQKYLGNRVCYLEDKGLPHDINDLPRDNK